MALVFNPFTGNFDNVMASSSDMSFSGGSLNVNGDITLDSGGTFTTTIQAITPTANRTISFPDQTGTVGLVSGATGNIQYNNAGQLAGTGDLNAELDWNSSTTVYTGLKLNATDTLSAAGSKLVDLQINGTTIGLVNSAGLRFTRTGSTSGLGDFYLDRQANYCGFYIAPNNTNVGVGANPNGYFAGANSVYSWTSGSIQTSSLLPDTGLAREAAGIVKITAGLSGTGYLKQTPVLTSALPAAATVGAGTRGFVSDAGSTTFNNPIGTGTGTPAAATTIPVFSDGSVWKAG